MVGITGQRCRPSRRDVDRVRSLSPRTYTISGTSADSSPGGPWHIAVLATADDGFSTLDTKAADLTTA